MSLPDLHTLECFLALSKHLNFREAARSVYLSPAAFGERIKSLEIELGGSLFERTTRKVSLTGLGARLIPHARRLIQEGWRWKEATRAEGALTPFHLKIGTRFELGMSWIVPAISRLKAAQPERSIELKWGTDRDLLSGLRSGALDGVISSVRVDLSAFEAKVLHREEYVFVISAGVQPVSLFTLDASDAPELTLIDTEAHLPLFRYFLDALNEGESWQFRETELMGTIAAVRARVLKGAGVAVLPLYFVHQDLEEGALTQLRPEVTLHHDFFRLIWHKDQARSSELVNLGETLSALPLS
jgi:LysR family transcriptional regulator, glycine cleavage system transcriptional activator